MNKRKRNPKAVQWMKYALAICIFLIGLGAGRSVYAQSFEVDSKGNIAWGTTATGNAYDGMHFQTIGWTFTVTNGSKKGSYTYYLGTAASSGTDSDGRKYNSVSSGITATFAGTYNSNYCLSLIQLEKDTGVSVRQGTAIITANAVVEFYYRSGTTKTSKAIAKTETDANSYCKTYGFSSNFSQNYTGYFNQKVTQTYVYLEVKKGTGISSVSGSGWYKPGAAVKISAVVAEGYTWSKWSGDKSSTSRTYTFKMPAKGTVLTANASIAIYKLKLDGNGGTVTRGSFTQSNYLLEKYNTSWGCYDLSGTAVFWSSKNPFSGFKAVRTGYEFQGFYTAASGGTQIIDSSGQILAGTTSFKKDTVLYAHWKAKTVKVIFHKNDGGRTTVTKTYEYGKANQAFSDPGWKRTGYELLGWALSSSATTQNYSVTCKILDSWIEKYSPQVDLYAVWSPVTLTVTFHRNLSPGDTATKTVVYTYGKSGQCLPDPGWVSSEYYPLGWAKTANAANANYTLTATVADSWINANRPRIDLYLIWNIIPCSVIKYHSGWDAAASTKTTIVRKGETGKLYTLEELGTGFSDAEKEFLGWAAWRESDGSYRIMDHPESWGDWTEDAYLYKDGAQVSVSVFDDVIHLYAQWESLDQPPMLQAADCYFTLQEAQAGLVTEEAIFLRSGARAWDKEDGEIPMGTAAKNQFVLYNYNKEEFEKLTYPAQISETFQVIDSSENTARCCIRVIIVDSSAHTDSDLRQQLRFISMEYLEEPRERGGLREDSIWKTSEYLALLKIALKW